MNSTDPAVLAYLDEVVNRLGRLEPNERTEIIAELENHIAEAVKGGRTTAETLDTLGEPAKLAQAYEMELTLGRRSGRNSLVAFLRVMGVLATLGLPTLVICTVLASVGVAFVVAGAGAFLLAL